MEKDDPWTYLENGWREFLSCVTRVHHEVRKKIRESFFPSQKMHPPALPLPPEITLDVVVVNALCGVCGEGFGKEYVSCLTCEAPYHGDCWDYMGKCSVYGCCSLRMWKASSRVSCASSYRHSP